MVFWGGRNVCMIKVTKEGSKERERGRKKERKKRKKKKKERKKKKKKERKRKKKRKVVNLANNGMSNPLLLLSVESSWVRHVMREMVSPARIYFIKSRFSIYCSGALYQA